MPFKRGFLRRPDAFRDGSSNRTPSKMGFKVPPLYCLPDSYTTQLITGPNAAAQKFAGVFEDPGVGYWRQNPNDSLTRFQPSTIMSMGPHVLLNLDLGSNAMNGESGREKIPTWITADQIDVLNELVGPAPPEGVEAAAKAGKKWGKVLPGPDLGGPRRDGEGVRWEMRSIEGKGFGLFALRDIEIGELVLSERPIQIMPTCFPFALKGEKVVSRVEWYTYPHELRDASQKARFESLFNAKEVVPLPNYENVAGTQASTLCEGITRTNRVAFEFLEDVSHHYTVVYGPTSRFNHSCGPNVGWRFNDLTFSNETRAFRKITAGEELTVSYVEDLATMAARHEWLYDQYQFTCNCHWCSLEGKSAAKSDVRRTKLGKWYKNRLTFDAWKSGKPGTRKELIEDQVGQIEAFQAEGLQYYLKDLYLDLAKAATAFADAAKAKKYASLAFEMLGDSYETRGLGKELAELNLIAEAPAKHPMWGTSSSQQ